jgi:hypothetical protein
VRVYKRIGAPAAVIFRVLADTGVTWSSMARGCSAGR